MVSRGLHGKYDLCVPTARPGAASSAAPGSHRKLETLAKEHPVRDVAHVRSWNECQAAIRSGCPVLVCSDQGFTMERDADGFCNPARMWYHAMVVIGIRGGARPGGFLLNSWGPDAHRGPRFPTDAPACGFWGRFRDPRPNATPGRLLDVQRTRRVCIRLEKEIRGQNSKVSKAGKTPGR